MAQDVRRELADRIERRRGSITACLTASRPRSSRLTTISIISSAVAAVLVAGPALGGESFAGGVGGALGLSTSSIVWRVLCFLGMLASLVAVITTNLQKSHDLPARISAAEAVDADLEGLQTLLQFGKTSTGDAVNLDQGYVSRIPFVDEPASTARPDLPERSAARPV
jgi:hypothetical protein